ICNVVYYELPRRNKSIMRDRYQLQLNRLNVTFMEKRSAVASNRRKVILLHDNARPHVANSVKETLMQFEWEVLPHPVYSPDLAPSDYYLFRSMQHGLVDAHFKTYEDVR
ncbi:Histone-lysine N-methyltransferase SETMAR, partial [Camponotus floridanus]